MHEGDTENSPAHETDHHERDPWPPSQHASVKSGAADERHDEHGRVRFGVEPSCELVDAPDAGEVLWREQDPQLPGLLQEVLEECDAGLVEARLSLVHAGLVEPKSWHRYPVVEKHQSPKRLALDIEELEEHVRHRDGPQAEKQRQRKDQRLGKVPEEDIEDRPRPPEHGAPLELGKPAQAVTESGSKKWVFLRATEEPAEAKGYCHVEALHRLARLCRP